MLERISAAWAALCGRPVYAALPPARLLELGPDDRVVLECEEKLARETAAQIKRDMATWLADDGTSSVVLSGGVRLVAVQRRQRSA